MTLAAILLAVGLILIIAEVLFPSFGVLSILATAAIVASIVTAFQAGVGPTFVGIAAVSVPTVLVVGFKLFPKTPMGRHMVIKGLSFKSQKATDARDLDLVGVEGEVEAPLRPAGIARLGGRRVDVVSRGDAIERGARVRVVEVSGNRVVVVRAD
jgi:membrane-bound serine protease (ClpP class)